MSISRRVREFCDHFDLRSPIMLAPMAGVTPPELSIAVVNAGGMGSCGVLLLTPEEITQWAATVRGGSGNRFQLNNWVPDPAPTRDREKERAVAAFLRAWGPAVSDDAGDATRIDFDAQCDAMLAARPAVVSSVMGLFPHTYVERLRRAGIAWFAVVSTVGEATSAEAAGADALIAQGMEAGGHRASFNPETAERDLVGLVALIPAVVDSVSIPVIATGGIADGRGAAAAFALGASAVQIGSGFLRCPEARINAAWAEALGRAAPEDTVITRAYTGRAARAVANHYVRSASDLGSPVPAPYPVQRGMTAGMRAEAASVSDINRMQAWAGQSAGLSRKDPAAAVVARVWSEARAILGSDGLR